MRFAAKFREGAASPRWRWAVGALLALTGLAGAALNGRVLWEARSPKTLTVLQGKNGSSPAPAPPSVSPSSLSPEEKNQRLLNARRGIAAYLALSDAATLSLVFGASESPRPTPTPTPTPTPDPAATPLLTATQEPTGGPSPPATTATPAATASPEATPVPRRERKTDVTALLTAAYKREAGERSLKGPDLEIPAALLEEAQEAAKAGPTAYLKLRDSKLKPAQKAYKSIVVLTSPTTAPTASTPPNRAALTNFILSLLTLIPAALLLTMQTQTMNTEKECAKNFLTSLENLEKEHKKAKVNPTRKVTELIEDRKQLTPELRSATEDFGEALVAYKNLLRQGGAYDVEQLVAKVNRGILDARKIINEFLEKQNRKEGPPTTGGETAPVSPIQDSKVASEAAIRDGYEHYKYFFSEVAKYLIPNVIYPTSDRIRETSLSRMLEEVRVLVNFKEDRRRNPTMELPIPAPQYTSASDSWQDTSSNSRQDEDKSPLETQITSLNGKITELKSQVTALNQEKTRARFYPDAFEKSADALRQKREAGELAAELRIFLTNLLEVEAVVQNAGVDELCKGGVHLGAIERAVYQSAPPPALLLVRNMDEAEIKFILEHIAALQKSLDFQLREKGLQPIIPAPGDRFDAKRFEAGERNEVYTAQPARHDTVASLKRMGFLRTDAGAGRDPVVRPALVLRYMYEPEARQEKPAKVPAKPDKTTDAEAAPKNPASESVPKPPVPRPPAPRPPYPVPHQKKPPVPPRLFPPIADQNVRPDAPSAYTLGAGETQTETPFNESAPDSEVLTRNPVETADAVKEVDPVETADAVKEVDPVEIADAVKEVGADAASPVAEKEPLAPSAETPAPDGGEETSADVPSGQVTVEAAADSEAAFPSGDRDEQGAVGLPSESPAPEVPLTPETTPPADAKTELETEQEEAHQDNTGQEMEEAQVAPPVAEPPYTPAPVASDNAPEQANASEKTGEDKTSEEKFGDANPDADADELTAPEDADTPQKEDKQEDEEPNPSENPIDSILNVAENRGGR